MKFSKRHSILFSIVLSFLLTACGGGTEGDSTPYAGLQTNPPVETTPTDPVPTDPVPTDPVPTDPVPTDPVPTDPVPTDPVPTDPVPTDPVPPPPVNTFTTSSTSQFLNELCVSWDYDLAANPDVIGFRIYDAQGAEVCSTEDLQILHFDCVYDATLPPSTFTMTAYDINLNESAYSAPFTVNKAPVADLVANGTNTAVQFDASASYDFDGGAIVTYSWDFGDGTSATGVTANHDYQPGVYTVNLEVVDSDGATTSTQVTITIA